MSVAVVGLPGQPLTRIVVVGPRGYRRVLRRPTRLHGLLPGRYHLTLGIATFTRSRHAIRAGAKAYPAERRLNVTVRRGGSVTVVARYVAVVNPATRPLPKGILGVTGDPRNPTGLVLTASGHTPKVGTILTSGPTAVLPAGLIAKVTRVTRQAKRLAVSLAAAPVSDAVPQITFDGNVPLKPAATAIRLAGSAVPAQAAGVPRAHAADACGHSVEAAPLSYGARLDGIRLKRATLSAWPVQLRLAITVDSSETLGIGSALTSIDCEWSLPEIGPYQAALPVGPLVIPVYATFPVRAGLHIEGSLTAASFNVSSTTVAEAAAGAAENKATLRPENQRVSATGSPSLAGNAKLTASIALQAGIGVPDAGNVHLQAAFGPELAWSSGHACELFADMGSLSAGIEVLGRPLNTPSFTPWKLHLWSGCQTTTTGGTTGSGGTSGGGGSPGGSGGGEGGTTIQGAPYVVQVPGTGPLAVGRQQQVAYVSNTATCEATPSGNEMEVISATGQVEWALPLNNSTGYDVECDSLPVLDQAGDVYIHALQHDGPNPYYEPGAIISFSPTGAFRWAVALKYGYGCYGNGPRPPKDMAPAANGILYILDQGCGGGTARLLGVDDATGTVAVDSGPLEIAGGLGVYEQGAILASYRGGVGARYYTFAGVEQDPWTAPPIPYLLGGWQSGMYTYGEDGSVYAVTDTLNGSSCNESWGFAVSAHIPGGTDWAFHSPMTSQGQEMCRVGSHEKEVAVRTPGGGLLVSADANTGVIGDSITSFNQGGAVAWVRLVDDPLVEGDRLEAGGITDVESSTTGEAVVLENVSRPKECKHDRCELVQLRFLNPSDGSQAQAPVELTPPEAREREIASDLYLVPGGAIVEIAQTGGAAPPTTLIQRVAAPQVGTDLRSP